MTNDRRVRSEARTIADGARPAIGLSDAEAECLRDLLKSDEAFAQLVTAQQAAVLVDADKHDAVDERTFTLARDGAQSLGDAIDRVVEERIEDAQAIVAFADAGGEPITWGVAMQLYQRGFTSIDQVRETDRHTLIAETTIAPALVDRIKGDVADAEEAQR